MAVQAYGGACSCCGESRLVMLTIDHVHGGGRQHRLRLPRNRATPSSSQELYREIHNAGYPEGMYQILCYNCQAAKGSVGDCPCQATPTVDEVAEFLTQGHLPLGHDMSTVGLRCMSTHFLGSIPAPFTRNQREAARVYLTAAAIAGEEVPDYIQDLAGMTHT